MTQKRRYRVFGLAALLMAAAALWLIARPAEGSRGILYQVVSPQGKAYLLGSIHVGGEAMYPFGEDLTRAMAASDTFVYECDTTSDAATAELRRRMALPEGQTLRDALGGELYAEVSAVCDHLGLDIGTLDGLRPWAVINTLAVYTTAAELRTDTVNRALSLGVEKQVQAYAMQNHKKVAYLETPDEQVDALEGLSDGLQRYLLQGECDVILHPENARGMDATIADWPEWWRAGDKAAFANRYLSSYLEPGHEDVCAEYHRVLVTERNARMAERLSALLKEGGTYFATVGLLHLVLPEDSIPTLLSERGYTVEAPDDPSPEASK